MKVLFVFTALIAFLVSAQEIVRIPLKRGESGLERALRLGEENLKILSEIEATQKARMRTKLLRGKKGLIDSPTNDTLPIFKYFETEYYGLINIGKPGKVFKIILDTAWGISWVPSVQCPRFHPPCAVHALYDHSRSSSYQPDGRIVNITEYFGFLSNDVFHVGHLNATGQVFGELTDFPWWYAFLASDGVLGLGLPGLAPSSIATFFTNFYKQNHLQPIFSMYINRDPTTPRGGSLFLGGIDYKHNKTAFQEIPVVGNNYWEFKMDKISLISSPKSHVDFCTSGCIAFADTSSNTIAGPEDEVRTINRLIGAAAIPFPYLSNRYLIPCVNTFKGPKVSFTINGQVYTIKAQDYIQKLSYSGVTICLSAFTPNYSNNTWGLGGAFLYRYYTAYDVEKKTIMIAEAA